ncbi:hypothetical protein GALL_451860 [mine drainage metagenome]|uniref:Uncharacterized protein n=1 Tax=mine drainage metagenome TaxID=410659 RepID=A0A1J5PPW1_9ZZZZ
MRDVVRGAVAGVVFAVDALRVVVWTDARVIGRLQARLGDGLAPCAHQTHLRWLRALGLATLFLPWLALGMVWSARVVELAQGPLWASKLLAFAGLLLAWAYGPGVLQWFRVPAWALAVYRQCGLDPRRQMPWLRRPRLRGHTPLDRRWRLARMWAGATALSLMGWAFVLFELPAGFVKDGLGILAIALLWMLGMVQGYTDRIGEVIELGSDQGG